MDIKENLTINNFSKSVFRSIKYIVIHYTSNDGDTAYGNTQYFKSVYRAASAHYFVDEKEIYRCVKDTDIAWHCGSTVYKHPKCRNSNSIGVEMCSDKVNGQYVITEQTIKNTLELVKYLMQEYGIPIENVIRHYDVTGKICPEPFVRDESKWINFKSELKATEDVYKALELLTKKSIINSPTYWLEVIKNTPYLDSLFINMAKYVELKK